MRAHGDRAAGCMGPTAPGLASTAQVAYCRRMVRASVQVTTAFVLPERRITNSLGECFGIVVRSLGLGGSVAASFKAMRKGEVTQYTTLLEDSRQQAIDRMVEKAAAMGANAVIGMRFDSSEMMQGLSEIVAYGTAVLVEPTGT